MTAIVVDASVMVKLLVEEEDSFKAALLVKTYLLIAPDFAFLEVGNTLWSRVHSGRLDGGSAQRLLRLLSEIKIDTVPSVPVVDRALALATAIDHPIYDCAYLALAEHRRIPLVTADTRFLSAARRHGLSEPRLIALSEMP